MRRLSLILGMIILAVLIAVFMMAFPTGSATGLVTATIAIDGRTITAQTVERNTAKTQWGLDAGLNYDRDFEGEADVFEINETETLFRRLGGSVESCARRGAFATNVAEMLIQFEGECDLAPAGYFVLAEDIGGDLPQFTEFRWIDGELRAPYGGGEADPVALRFAARGFDFLSLNVEATTAPLSNDMTARFPWILQLDRLDCSTWDRPGRTCWRAGTIYAEYFTSALP